MKKILMITLSALALAGCRMFSDKPECFVDGEGYATFILRGPFPILSTPYFEDGAVDYESLGKGVQFVDDSGCPGVIWCQQNDAIDLLTYEEKIKGFEACAAASVGRNIIMTLGANGTNTAAMLQFAREIERIAAKYPAAKIAMISRPPDDVTTQEQLEAAWDKLGAIAKRPVIFQTYCSKTTPTPTVDMLIRLAKKHPKVFGYVKEEAAGNQANERMVLESQAKPVMKTVFCGWGGWQWLYQLRQCGCEGLVTERCAYAPILASIWKHFESGDKEGKLASAFAMYRLLIDQRNFPGGLRGYSLYFLKKHGVFKNMVTREYVKGKNTEGGMFGTTKQWKLSEVKLSERQMKELDMLYDDMYRFAND